MQIFYGKDEALIESHVRLLYPKIKLVNGQKELASRLSDACSASLFGESGPVAITNCDFLISGTVNAADKEALAGLKDLDSSQLILLASGDKLTVNPFINKNVIAAAKTKKIAALTERSAYQAVVKEAERMGISMQEDAIQLVLNRLPLSWGIIASEIEKIALLSEKKISALAIKDLVSSYTDDTVFSWTDSFLACDWPRNYELYQILRRNGTEETELMGILAGQLVYLKCARMAYERTPSMPAVAAATGMPVYRVANNFHFIAKTPRKVIQKLIDAVKRCDLMSKDGSLSKEAALKVLIISAMGIGDYGKS